MNSERTRERGSLLFFDERVRPSKEMQPPFPMRDLHGIESVDDNIFVTCAFDNMVAILDLATDTWRKWYPSADLSAREHDVNHFNTIYAFGKQLAVLAHNWGASHILFYNYPSLDLESIRPLGVQAHNIFFVNGSLTTCSSAEGGLVSEAGWRLRTGNFPRGFATDGRLKLVGLSPSAERLERSVASSVIRVFDECWQFQADYVLGGVGMILDILPISFNNTEDLGLDRFEQVEIYEEHYNPESPGDCYLTGEGRTLTDQWLEWHKAEGIRCWTASRSASMEIVINPGEKFLVVDIASEFPKHYMVDIYVDSQFLGRQDYSGPAVQRSTFSLDGQSAGPARLFFKVPHLWVPADEIPGNRDFRSLGVSVRSVQLALGPTANK